MSPISRGFFGRRQPVEDAARVPPGQYVTRDFPVLSAGPTPHTPLDEWSFTVSGQVEEPVSWTWHEFLALPGDADGRHPLRGEPLESEHGGPARRPVGHRYFWKSAKWVRGLALTPDNKSGFWETHGYHNHGDPWLEQRYQSD